MLRYNLPDRRKVYRVYVQIPVECEMVNPEDKSIRKKIAIASDINSGGLYFQIDEPLSLNTELDITFQLPKTSHPIHATIRVVRLEIVEEEKNFGIGAAFIKLTDEDKEKIKQLVERLNINQLLDLAIKKKASDLHLVVNQPPILRVYGDLEILDMPKLYDEDIINMLYSIMSKQQIKTFEQEKELNFGIQYGAQSRFRVNVHQQRGSVEAVFRLIDTKISSLEELRIPAVVKDLALLKDGLILIVGPTGSGKSTTIAAMVELINQQRKAVVITLERPIEYVHSNIKSIIKQREVGVDTRSFYEALRNSLKQDPNVIVIGELEDIETVKTTLIAAEAGHLVIVSFHAPNILQAIDRLTNMFPTENRRQLLFQISNSLRGMVSQLLIPCKDKRERVLATEILITTEASRKIIRNDELIQIPTIIQTGALYGMQSMDESIRRYMEQGIIDLETGNFYSEEFKRYLYTHR